ncbi:glycosyltransferase family 8 protein [Hymenobacter wooponensis]|uniref:Glycosyltransferase family 8 protein n=1 Tax=Hymenobacter wooponensis TaxID=1525360 RepID=A0A4Z0MTM3_9BACT|nr:glycosyltransferase family 8 protein [Hymenobacter wooponensis]TGD82984.1 glycosyltransferase family 8 protein [Hymenobacter wooponensis]
MDSTLPAVHVALAFDKNYLAQFYALASSIYDNNRHNLICLHAVVSGIDEDCKSFIQQWVNSFNSSIVFYTIDQDIVSKFVLSGTWTAAVYYRLFFPFLVPESVENLLYIDTDTLVVGDLRQFSLLELEGRPVAAVYDNWVKNQPLLGITQEGDYFNSGVLYMDLAEWRRQQITEKAFEYLLQFPERIKFVDQCALNAVLIGNWKKIDSRFNTLYSYIPEDLSHKQFNRFLQDKIILHFTLQRPWTMLCQNRFRYLYQDYLQRSPSKNKKVYSDFSISKVPALLRIRLRELYMDNPALGQQWRRIKTLLR